MFQLIPPTDFYEVLPRQRDVYRYSEAWLMAQPTVCNRPHIKVSENAITTGFAETCEFCLGQGIFLFNFQNESVPEL